MRLTSIFAILLLASCGATQEPQVTTIVAQCEISSDLKFIRTLDEQGQPIQYYSINDKILLPFSGHVSGRYQPINKTFMLSRNEFVCTKL